MKSFCNCLLGISILLSGPFSLATELQPADALQPDAVKASTEHPAPAVPAVQFKGNGFVISELNTKQQEAEVPAIQFLWENRVRNEDLENAMDYSNYMDDEFVQMRYKEHAALTYTSVPVDFMFGLDIETYKRMALNNAEVDIYSNQFSYKLNLSEIFVEYLNLNIKKLFIPRLSVKAGRQDFERGEGFLFMDGTSGDGSRSNYYNMVNFTYQHAKSKFELVGIIDPQMERFLPTVHNQKTGLTEWDEQAIGLYYTDRNRKNTDIDGYAFYKKEVNEKQYPNTSYQFQPDRHISTIGGRLVQRVKNGYTISGEFAGQWGEQHANTATGSIIGAGLTTTTGIVLPAIQAATPAKNIAAWGGSAYVNKAFDARFNPYVQVGLIGYSGNDYSSTGNDPSKLKTINNFDSLFSRWPHYSELYLYSMVPEVGVAYWTNNKLMKFEAGLNPRIPHMKSFNIRATLYDEYAFHPFTPGATALNWPPFQDVGSQQIVMYSKTGTHRGENWQARTNYEFNDRWEGHIEYDKFVPGDFYSGGYIKSSPATAFFLQSELKYHFDMIAFRFNKR